MRKDVSVARFTPPTPRSRRLGRELRKLRDTCGWTMDGTAKQLGCSTSRISRIESGDIKPKPGDVMELLVAYGVPLDAEPGTSLLALARELRESGWWQRLDSLSNRYATFIAYEAEAAELRNFQPTLVPGLLQTEDYARAISSVGRETDEEAIEQWVRARLTRQDVLTRTPTPLHLHAILSEATLLVEVGGPHVLRAQLDHLVALAARPHITVQVLQFAAGATLAVHGGFAVLTFTSGDPPLGYCETVAGELFLESPREIDQLTTVFDHLETLALSPAESVTYIKETKERAHGT